MNTRTSRLLATAVASLLVGTLAACSSGSDTADGQSASNGANGSSASQPATDNSSPSASGDNSSSPSGDASTSSGDSSSSSGDASADGTCTPKHTFATVAPGKLTVSAHPSLPYFSYDQQTSEVGGVDGDVIKAIADMECLELVVQVIPGAGALQSVESGKVDSSVAGWYITPERTAVMGMTDPFYYDFTAIVSKDGASKLSQVKGEDVGMVAGSVFVGPLGEVLGADHVRTYQLADAVVKDLAAGRIAAAVLGSGQAGFLAGKTPGLKVEKLQNEAGFNADIQSGKIGFPFAKNNTDLGKAFNEDIAELRDNGTVKKVLDKYGMTNPANYDPES